MPIKIAINGFGRIGRLVFRELWEDPLFEVVAVNDLCSVQSASYLLKYDSVHGTWTKKVEVAADQTGFNVSTATSTSKVCFSQAKTIEDACKAWEAAGQVVPDMVAECTGKFNKAPKLRKYFECGVKKVVVSAPVKDVLNVVLGCNEELITHETHLVTNASCTTNCLAPVVKVLQESFGIKHGCITTIHDVTGTQTLVDMPNTKKDDLRRARTGMLNLVPTSTGSATAITEIYPQLKGKINGLAVRVPVLNGSITDCVFEVNRETTAEEVNAAMKKASESGRLVGILGYEEQPLVSTDYVNDPRSSIIDAPSTQVIDKTLVKVYAWYDNEFGYSRRMADLCHLVADKFLRPRAKL